MPEPSVWEEGSALATAAALSWFRTVSLTGVPVRTCGRGVAKSCSSFPSTMRSSPAARRVAASGLKMVSSWERPPFWIAITSNPVSLWMRASARVRPAIPEAASMSLIDMAGQAEPARRHVEERGCGRPHQQGRHPQRARHVRADHMVGSGPVHLRGAVIPLGAPDDDELRIQVPG